MKRSALITLVAAAALPVTSVEAQTRPPTPNPMTPIPTLRADATMEVQAAPDLAIVRLGVFAEAPDAAAAQKKTSDTMEKITRAVKAQGVPAERIMTERLELQPNYDYRPNEPPRLVGYRSNIALRIEVELGSPPKAERVGKVVAAAVAQGGNQVQGIEFTLRNDEPALLKALDGAVKKARARVDVMAKAADVQVGELIELTHGGGQVRPPQPVMMPAREMMMKAADEAVPVSAGELTVRVSVGVVYALRQR